MNAKELILDMYKAIIAKDSQEEKRLWLEVLKLSLNHEHTEIVI